MEEEKTIAKVDVALATCHIEKYSSKLYLKKRKT